MENTLQYKGYFTNIAFSVEDKVLHGKIEGIDDLVTFESDSILDIEEEFHNAVDDYLDFCKEVGKEPTKAYKGSFNVRIDPQLHKKIALEAAKKGISLNQAVEKAIEQYLYDGDGYSRVASSERKISDIMKEDWVSGDAWQYNQANANYKYASISSYGN